MRSKFRGFDIEEKSKYYLVYTPDKKFFGKFDRYTPIIGAIIAQWKRENGVRD